MSSRFLGMMGLGSAVMFAASIIIGCPNIVTGALLLNTTVLLCTSAIVEALGK